jgi:O-antigen/teichoic acid export membrane protein
VAIKRSTAGARRLAGFSSTVAISAAVSLAVIPLIISTVGASQWAAIAVGQSIGSIGRTIIALGWGYSGPTMIAGSTDAKRVTIVQDSLVARILLAVPIGAASCAIAALLEPKTPAVAGLAALAVAIGGLGLDWYFVGRENPRLLLLCDLMPRTLGTVIGGVVLWTSHSLLLFVCVQVVGAVASVVVSAITILHGKQPTYSVKRAIRETWLHMYASVTVLVVSCYLSSPTIVVAAFAPQDVAKYALADRIGRAALMGVTPLNQWLQGWVPRREATADLNNRIRVARKASAYMSAVLAVLVCALGPVGVAVLSHGSVILFYPTLVAVAVTVGMSIQSRTLGMAGLLPLGARRPVLISALLGAAVGVPLLLVLTPIAGAFGAASAVACSEVVVTAYQRRAIGRAMRARRTN